MGRGSRPTLQAGQSRASKPVSLRGRSWSQHTANGRTANALVPDTLGSLAGGACFNDARVEVEPVPLPSA